MFYVIKPLDVFYACKCVFSFVTVRIVMRLFQLQAEVNECTGMHIRLQLSLSMCNSSVMSMKYMQLKSPMLFMRAIKFTSVKRDSGSYLHMSPVKTGNMACVYGCRCLLHTRSQYHSFSLVSVRDGVYVSFRSRYFPSLCQSVQLTHGPLSFGMISAMQTPQTHTYAHAHTQKHCLSLHHSSLTGTH